MAADRRLLLLCPRFFSYHEDVLGAAERLGIDAFWQDDRGAGSWLFKAGLKVAPDMVRRATQGPLRCALAARDLAGTDDILIVKGDGLTAESLAWLRDRAPTARVTLYLWDNVRNVPGILALAALADRVVTFDPDDAVALGWMLLPLFSRTALLDPADLAEAQYDWSFVGTLHSDRHRVLRRLRDALPEARVFTHLYTQNRIVQIVRAMRDPGVLRPGSVSIVTDVLAPASYHRITLASRAVVDIEHPVQTGLTMRTLETLLSGRKLITTNRALLDYAIYDPSRAAVIDRADPRIDPAFFQTPFLPLDPDEGRRYHVNGWLAQVLDPDGWSPLRATTTRTASAA